jgi:ABC-type phosphate transport system auxiliary subunit
MAYSLNNLLARFHSLLQIEANSRKLQTDAKQAISSSQARATQLKEELTLIHTDMTRLTTLIRDAKTKKSPIPVVGCHTMVGSLYQELGGSYVSSSGGL